MYSKAEKKAFQQQFWDSFGQFSAPKRRALGFPKQWMLHNTGIKAIDLKFDFSEDKASVGIDIVSKSQDSRTAYWNIMLGLKNLLHEAMGQPMIWDKHYVLDSGKEIARIALYNKEVGIYQPATYEATWQFFFQHMINLENWFIEYKEIIRVPNQQI